MMQSPYISADTVNAPTNGRDVNVSVTGVESTSTDGCSCVNSFHQRYIQAIYIGIIIIWYGIVRIAR